MDDITVVRRAFLGTYAPIALKARPLELYVDAIADWATIIAELQRKRFSGEISPHVILPTEIRDVSMFLFAALVRQTTEATERGESELAFAVDVDGDLVLQTVQAFRTFARFARAIAETGVFERAPSPTTLTLIDEIATELAQRTRRDAARANLPT